MNWLLVIYLVFPTHSSGVPASVPSLGFATQEECEQAVTALKENARKNFVRFNGSCVNIREPMGD